MEITAAQLAALVNGTVDGNPETKVSTYSKIEEARSGSLSFISNPKYAHYIYTTEASIVLVTKSFTVERPISPTLVRVEDPYSVLAMLLNMVANSRPRKFGIEANSFISSSAVVADDVYIGTFSYISDNSEIGKNSQIYPQCFIGENVKIGENVILYPGVKVYRDCVIGNNCIIHAGTVIGADGFGFAPNEKGEYTKISQIGNVVIEDNVEIGANATIDRATMGSTIIRKGVKLDNLIQIAHNVEVGEHTVMAAQVGVAGSTKIGRHNMVGGQVGFAGHITIGDNNEIGAQSGIPNNVDSGNRLIGYPAIDARDFARQTVYIKKLAELNRTVSELKKQIENLK